MARNGSTTARLGRDQALTRFETFLFCAIGTVLVTRAYLASAGYPQVGHGTLHIAHVLYGGLAMFVAIVMTVTGIGSQLHWWASVIGGIGFGLFIDEVGKFITRSVDYFYAPAVAIIYLVFTVAYVVVRTILSRRRLSDERRMALGAVAAVDQAIGELSIRERDIALKLLDGMAQPTPASVALRASLASGEVVHGTVRRQVHAFWQKILSALRALTGTVVVQVVVLALLIYGTAWRLITYVSYLNVIIDDQKLDRELEEITGDRQNLFHFSNYGWYLLGANLLCAAIVAIGIVLVVVPRIRRPGLVVVQWGLVLDLMLNQFAAFHADQFHALWQFTIELVAWLVVRSLISRGEESGEMPAPAGGTSVVPTPVAA